MAIDLTGFNKPELETLIGGLHSLEMESLRDFSLESAYSFIEGYGYNLSEQQQRDKLWEYHSRAIAYIRSDILTDDEEVPSELCSRSELGDIAKLLLFANDNGPLKTWACAILKIIHVLNHLDNDLFTVFSKEIQEQILSPLKKKIYKGPMSGPILKGEKGEKVELKKFIVKPFKRPESTLTKLLAKPEVVAFSILDKIGARFVTKDIYDVFNILKILIADNVISVPHTVPKESNNTLYPLPLFIDVVKKMQGKSMTHKEINEILQKQLELKRMGDPGFNIKKNVFTDENYRFIKFISRKLIRVNISLSGKERLWSFFYPFEIQLMDYQTYLSNMSGKASHDAYKNRQKDEVRRRIFHLDKAWSLVKEK